MTRLLLRRIRMALRLEMARVMSSSRFGALESAPDPRQIFLSFTTGLGKPVTSSSLESGGKNPYKKQDLLNQCPKDDYTRLVPLSGLRHRHNLIVDNLSEVETPMMIEHVDEPETFLIHRCVVHGRDPVRAYKLVQYLICSREILGAHILPAPDPIVSEETADMIDILIQPVWILFKARYTIH